MTRLNLATDLKTRIGAPSAKDARQVNSYVEVKGDQTVVRKRPAAQGGIAVGTGTAQGGIGLTINGTPYFIGFWGDVLYSATMTSLANGGQYGWSSTTAYTIGDFIDYVETPPSDPFANPPTITRYYAMGPNTNKPPSTDPNYWSTSQAGNSRWNVRGSAYDGVLHIGEDCATIEAAAQSWFDMVIYKTCPGLPATSYSWIETPVTFPEGTNTGAYAYYHVWAAAGGNCGLATDFGAAQIGYITKVV